MPTPGKATEFQVFGKSLVIAGLLAQLLRGADAASVPPTGQAEGRSNLSLQHEVQHAIDRASAWLKTHQDAKGFWSTADQPAVTALALIALQGAVPAQSIESSPALKNGYAYVLSCVKPDGGIFQKPELVTYNTALSLLALLAAHQPEYTPIILKARAYLVGLQTDFGEPGKVDDVFDGGIGYGSKYKHSDMSNTMQALEALYYSRALAQDQSLAGARDLNWQAAIHFIQNCQNLPGYNQQAWVTGDPQNKGGFIYYPGQSMAGETNLPSGRVALRSYGSISYAGLLSYAYADLKRDDPRVQAVLDWLTRNYTLAENPGMGQQGLFFYYQTMAKALSLTGIDSLQLSDGHQVNWREALALRLIDLQQKDGSWFNETGRWWEKDPALVTSYALISLERIASKL